MIGVHCAGDCREPRTEALTLYRDGVLALPAPPASPTPPRCDAVLVGFVGDDADLDTLDDRNDDLAREPGAPPPPVDRIGVETILLKIAGWGLQLWFAARRDRRTVGRDLVCRRST